VVLAGIEGHERSGFALHGLFFGGDREPARDYLDDRALANVVIAKFLAALKVDHDRPALGAREQHARHLVDGSRHTRRIGSRLAGSTLRR
jgi:hypothetical protein